MGNVWGKMWQNMAAYDDMWQEVCFFITRCMAKHVVDLWPFREDPSLEAGDYSLAGYSLQGGCRGRGVQWIGIVLYNKLVHNII